MAFVVAHILRSFNRQEPLRASHEIAVQRISASPHFLITLWTRIRQKVILNNNCSIVVPQLSNVIPFRMTFSMIFQFHCRAQAVSNECLHLECVAPFTILLLAINWQTIFISCLFCCRPFAHLNASAIVKCSHSPPRQPTKTPFTFRRPCSVVYRTCAAQREVRIHRLANNKKRTSRR